MQAYQITVWYRFVVFGEQEKDFEVHSVNATSLQEAVNKVADMYNSHRQIPFAYYYQDTKLAPNNFKK